MANERIYWVRTSYEAFAEEKAVLEPPQTTGKINLRIIEEDLELVDALAKHRGISRATLLNHLLHDGLVHRLHRMPADQRAWLILAADRVFLGRPVDRPWVDDFYDDAREKACEEMEQEPHSYEYLRMLGEIPPEPPAEVRAYIDLKAVDPVWEYVTLRPEPKLQVMLELLESKDVYCSVPILIPEALRRFALSNGKHASVLEELTRKFLIAGGPILIRSSEGFSRTAS
ncbi:hypothetical protein [Sutterella sp.]|uniref:hypothetical protein n=1 Tax=Sutterella sp. TaxID=1981025 RepID=UPI0026DFA5F1|nr:hypothetical protein [Sutterella sp.]MDO5532002.1 hypothetical protein [Sutterella sp.]